MRSSTRNTCAGELKKRRNDWRSDYIWNIILLFKQNPECLLWFMMSCSFHPHRVSLTNSAEKQVSHALKARIMSCAMKAYLCWCYAGFYM